jgi:hypothetical protein
MTSVVSGDIFFGLFSLGLGLTMFWFWKKTSYSDKYLLLVIILSVVSFLLDGFDLITNAFHLSSELRFVSYKALNLSSPIIAIVAFGALLYGSRKRGTAHGTTK